MIIKGATGVAIAAAIGNLLQGWDGGAIAGGCVLILQEPFFFLLLLLPSSFFLLPFTSSSSLVSLTVTARPSICLSTTLLLRVQGLLQGKKTLCKENLLVSNFPSQLSANYWCKSMNPPCPPLFLHSTIKSIRCSRRIKCTTNLCFDSTTT